MNYWSIENENGDSTLLFNVSISGIIFMEFKKVASFQKDLIFISTKLITLTMQIHYNEFLINLEIKIVWFKGFIFFLKLNFS